MGDCTEAEIPVIDFSAYRLSLTKPDTTQFRKLVDDVHKALTTIGFFFMINTDFPQEKVENLHRVSKTFFELPVELKKKVIRIPSNGSHGYVNIEMENTNPDRPHGDLKEAFNLNPSSDLEAWPLESDCPGFKSSHEEFFDLCVPLHNRVLEVLAYGLKLEDPLFFVKHHSKPKTESPIILRTLFYPSLNGLTVKEQQVRCGEHSDYGGITLLFQQKRGLEVRKRDGTYVKVPLVDGGILVNIGDLMQRWTSDVYTAARHRVYMDDSVEERGKTRQSIVFFGYPDNEAIIECTDKSNKYPPVKSIEYLKMKHSTTYLY
ncbi:uncharacterized protein [Asterias amurensis]|uniref:uncharacterized protein n=1 Tax=Asterias amurensis TaxID=7602 RepID=UPI003AB85BD2